MKFSNLYHLIQKNLKLLIRSKSSALIVILAPLMIILLIGLSYGTSQTSFNIGVHAPTFTPEIDSLIVSLNEEYRVVKYDKIDECVEDVKHGFVHTCLSLPQDFLIQGNQQKEIKFYVDQTKINLVYLIQDTLNQKFNLKSQEISQDLISEIIAKLSHTQNQIGEKVAQLNSLKEKNQQTLSQAQSLQNSFNSLDLTPPSTTYNTSVINTFKENASAKISSALSSLEEIRNDLSSSSLNESEKTALTNNLDQVEDKIDQLNFLIENSGQGTLEELSSLISSLQSDLETAKNKLTTASQKITSTNTQISTLSSNLNEELSSLSSLQETLSEIQKNLAEQKITDPDTLASPLVTTTEKIAVERTHLNYLFPNLMILVVMFISLLLGTTLVMMEKHNQAYFRNFILPVKKITFIFSTYLTNTFLVLIQIVIILSISLILLKDILPQLPLTLLLLLVSSSVFTLIGMALGYLFTSEDTATLASISFGALFLFLSGVILPLESMPTLIRKITYYNPFVLSEKILREIFIFKSKFSFVLNEFLILVAYSVLLFLIVLVIESAIRQHFFARFFHQYHHKSLKKKKKNKAQIL